VAGLFAYISVELEVTVFRVKWPAVGLVLISWAIGRWVWGTMF